MAKLRQFSPQKFKAEMQASFTYCNSKMHCKQAQWGKKQKTKQKEFNIAFSQIFQTMQTLYAQCEGVQKYPQLV